MEDGLIRELGDGEPSLEANVDSLGRDSGSGLFALDGDAVDEMENFDEIGDETTFDRRRSSSRAAGGAGSRRSSKSPDKKATAAGSPTKGKRRASKAPSIKSNDTNGKRFERATQKMGVCFIIAIEVSQFVSRLCIYQSIHFSVTLPGPAFLAVYVNT